jgi:hypothetical protein
MNKQDVIDSFKEAGLTDHQAEQVGYLYTQFGALQFDAAQGYTFKSNDYLNHDTLRKAAANPMFPRNLNW